jgi:hypothetical protein
MYRNRYTGPIKTNKGIDMNADQAKDQQLNLHLDSMDRVESVFEESYDVDYDSAQMVKEYNAFMSSAGKDHYLIEEVA